MSKKSFMPKNDDARQNWLTNFANKINSYHTKYSVSAVEVTDMQDGDT